MPKKIFFLLFFIFCLTQPIASFAVTDTPTPTGIPTCDLCGWCPPDATVNPTKPSNWNACNLCLYKPDGTPREKSYYTVLGCFSTDPSAAPFTQSILSIVFGIAGGISFLAVIYGRGLVLTSSGDPQQLQHGKEVIFSSILGVLLIVFYIFLLKVVGVDILGLPGFG